MITVFSNNKEVPVNRINFSDGAFTYCLSDLPEKPDYISINVDTRTPVKDVREEVDMVLSCLDNFYGDTTRFTDFILNLPYLPYARQDRVFEKGNPSPLYDFLVWLDRKNFAKINVCDIHNNKVLEEYPVDNLFEKSQLECYKESLPHDFNEKYDYIIASDKGAMNKAATIANYHGWETGCIYAGKKRDISTGKIIETTIPEEYNLNGAKVLIPDDLGDGLGTFIFLAEKLRERGVKEIHLYVTHLISSKGLKCIDGVIDKVYYHHIVANYINDQDVLNFNLRKV